jgi:hypothetical protein
MTATTLTKRIRDWKEHGRPPVTVWNRDGRRRLVVGGGRTRGWMLAPQLVLDPGQLIVGVTWQAPWHGTDYADPNPVVFLHLPGAYLWSRIYRVHAGFRAIPCTERHHPGDPGPWEELA